MTIWGDDVAVFYDESRFESEYKYASVLFFIKCFIFSFNRIPSSAETQVAGFDPIWAYYLCSKVKDFTR